MTAPDTTGEDAGARESKELIGSSDAGSKLRERSETQAALVRQFAAKLAHAFGTFRHAQVIEEPKVGVLDLTGTIEEGPDGLLRFTSPIEASTLTAPTVEDTTLVSPSDALNRTAGAGHEGG